ncbi:DNA cytosine methyltransferase [Oscillospiraceae bacterium LTW-04]
MIHLGDISKIDGSKIEPVDVITFGSPCQDLSVAGKRKGLSGERSGLFMEAVRIIREMREATDGLYPNYAIWENVPGAFSSNGGRDFAAVLEELCRLCDPRARINLPDKGKWRKADYFCDGSWSIAYRVFDAQFWGVPQRRRRIALVVDFRGNTAPEILFERQGLRRNFTPSRKAREEVAGDIGEGAKVYNESGQGYWMPGFGCLRAEGENRPSRPSHCICYGFTNRGLVSGDVAETARSECHGALPMVCYGIGGYNSAGMMSDNPKAGFYEANTSRTLDCNGGNPACNQGGIAVVQSVTLDCRNMAVNPELSGTIQAKNNGGQSLNYINPVMHPQVVGTLAASGAGTDRPAGQKNETDFCIAYSQQRSDEYMKNDVVSTQSARQYKDATDLIVNLWHWVVRRLTPLECERLQGYPDYWTDVPPITELSEQDMAFWREVFNTWDDINGVKHHSDKQILKWLSEPPADGPRYKSLGNSIARPSWKWVLKRLSAQFERDATLGSLFDGIGGFPLIWEQINGAGSARWASEIEPFPIRVTWTRFSRR